MNRSRKPFIKLVKTERQRCPVISHENLKSNLPLPLSQGKPRGNFGKKKPFQPSSSDEAHHIHNSFMQEFACSHTALLALLARPEI